MKFKQKIYLTYDDILSMCQNLEYDVSKMRPELIVGVSRGGLLPAVHLSHALDIPMVPIQWQTRDGAKKELNREIEVAIRQKKTVVFVDDINDTGKTFTELKAEYKGGLFAALVERLGTTFETDARSLRFDDQRWIVFPWEKD